MAAFKSISSVQSNLGSINMNRSVCVCACACTLCTGLDDACVMLSVSVLLMVSVRRQRLSKCTNKVLHTLFAAGLVFSETDLPRTLTPLACGIAVSQVRITSETSRGTSRKTSISQGTLPTTFRGTYPTSLCSATPPGCPIPVCLEAAL
jgi:hypothetical protein